tara:strand:- start:5380 stop:5628 length:249 start_codon:yes stop_codon:yes gene_type:complete
MSEFFENTLLIEKGYEMKVAPVRTMSSSEFQKSIMAAETVERKLAVCFSKLSEQGAFSDAPVDLHEYRFRILKHLPEELRDG